MSTRLWSPKLTKAIRHAINEAELAYALSRLSHHGCAHPVLAVEQVYLREADRIALRLDHQHDTISNHPTSNAARTP